MVNSFATFFNVKFCLENMTACFRKYDDFDFGKLR